MGSVDASAGFANQHAQTVHLALTIAAGPNLHAIRVEAENDILDVEIRSQAGHLVKGSSALRRSSRDTVEAAIPNSRAISRTLLSGAAQISDRVPLIGRKIAGVEPFWRLSRPPADSAPARRQY